MLSGREYKDPELDVVAHSCNLSTQEQRPACDALRLYFQNKTKHNKVSNIQVKSSTLPDPGLFIFSIFICKTRTKVTAATSWDC